MREREKKKGKGRERERERERKKMRKEEREREKRKRKEAEWRKGDNKGNLDSLTDLSTKEKQGDGQIEFIHLLETF